ncbi:hypothetical protein NC652_013218 [Populus alba x Populus x berolinensis]|nr:hypothetical protein NC652_013218 [Populus alba x Populus x berolinensis]
MEILLGTSKLVQAIGDGKTSGNRWWSKTVGHRMLARDDCVLLGHSRGRWRRCSVMILGLFLGGWWLVAGGCGVRLGSLKGAVMGSG